MNNYAVMSFIVFILCYYFMNVHYFINFCSPVSSLLTGDSPASIGVLTVPILYSMLNVAFMSSLFDGV